jgi:S-adenosyl-L-methionine hydrolase (adenosine-forming)
MRPIVFLSDYGLEDEFVGVCHMVIARSAPRAWVIDLTHGVPRGDIARGAQVLADAVGYAPAGAVFLAVVDPGVGTKRLSLTVEAGESFLVGPDNGLLSLAWDALGGVKRAYVIESDRVTLQPISATFHGRDIFAPVAAHLATGLSVADVGTPLEPMQMKRLQAPGATSEPGSVRCTVIGIDRFGNVQLSARAEHLHQARIDSLTELEVSTSGKHLSARRAQTFGEVPTGAAAVIVNSNGRLALVVNTGNAAAALGLGMGDPVEVGAPGRTGESFLKDSPTG